jgi:DNA modification methylase
MQDGKRVEVHTRKRTSGYKNGDTDHKMKGWVQPKKANPGNVIKCIAGGGHLGSKLAHENEAPFPEKLAEFFIKSFCPPGGTVLDPFSGSGTTIAVAKKNYRNGIGIDVRESQVELGHKRLETL